MDDNLIADPEPHFLEPDFSRACALRAEGKVEEALEILERLRAAHPENKAVVGYLGGCLWTAGKLERALPVVLESVRLSPKSKRASLGLFHTLWQLDRREEALIEVERHFTATGELIEDYREILKEIGEKYP